MSRKVFYFLIFNFYLNLPCIIAQSKTGLTGIADTSYSVRSEFNKHHKNYPFIRIAEESPVNYITVEENIRYCSTRQKELKLDAYYIKDDGGSAKKAIIFIFGGGWRSGNKEMHHPLLKELASLGYVCFAPDYRLSTDALYPAAVHDIKTVIRWVRKNAKRFNIDPNKIIISGHSAGGELAAFMGATNGIKKFEGEGCEKKMSSKVNAVIDIDGTLAFIHPESGEGDDSKKISAATYWLGYSKSENPELWKEAAPLTQVGKQSPPFQFINSGIARMHAGREDFISVLNKHKIYSAVKTFEGSPHTFLLFHPWFDSVVVYMDAFIKKVFPEKLPPGKIITVASDGSGNFQTIQAAINSIPGKNNKPVTIYLKNGIYKEKLFIDSAQNHVTLKGENKLNTIITWDDHTGKIAPSGDTVNTRTSWTVKIRGKNFTARDITFRNDAGYNAGQAVAVESDGDIARFFNCRFIGNQDVLFTNEEYSRQYYEHCYIEGTTDFIFGSSTVWFEKCHIHSKKNSHVTAASTPKEKPFGYIFNNCMLTGDTSLHGVSLGRPWRPYAQVLVMHSFIGPHIKPEGWSNWNNTDNYLTTRYAEFLNYGPGADISGRVKWAKQLNAAQVKTFTINNVMNGWNPHL